MNAAAQGDNALANSDFPSAIRHFTQALIELPRAPTYYIKRSTAHTRLKPANGGPNSHAALRDAEIALALAQERGKREIILSAQMRRGVALFQLERFGDAGFVFDTIRAKTTTAESEGQDKSEKVKNAMAGGGSASAKKGYEQELPIWTLKLKGKLNKLAEGDEKATVNVVEYPSDTKIPSEKDLKKQLEALKAGNTAGIPEDDKTQSQAEVDASTEKASESKAGAGSAPSAAPSASPAPEKVRHEWYQSHDSVVVTLYVKGVQKDKVDIDLKGDSVALQFPLPSGADYDFTLDPLFAPVDPSSSKVSVMSTKIEIVLRKQIPGQKWGALESSSTGVKLADRQAVTGATPAPDGPSYPTSSRHGAKDWDKLASTLTAKKSKDSEKKGKEKKTNQGEDNGNESDGAESVDSDYGGGDPVDAFFKRLYAGADPDTRRAMMKSYVESQGTSLSTNWGEVGSGKVEPRPPSE